MQKQRLEADLALIKDLLDCPKGQELALLQAHNDLVDDDLVQVMDQLAEQMVEEHQLEAANFLATWAEELRNALSLPLAEGSVADNRDRRALLQQVLQTIKATAGDPSALFDLLQNHLGQLDATFTQVLRDTAAETLAAADSQTARQFATELIILADLLQQFSLGSRSQHLETALAGFHIALSVFDHQTYPKEWALIQSSLGDVYCQRQLGHKAENIEAAIAAFQAALTVYTREAFFQEWGIVQAHLGAAYRQRIAGDYTTNLEQAIGALSAALQVYLPDY
jgi:hypothetical protein